MFQFLWLVLNIVAVTAISLPALAAPKQGDFLQTDGLSTLLVNRDFTEKKTTNIAKAFNISEVIGLHYYFVDRVRLGMSVQFTQRVTPRPEPGSGRLQRIAFMPQIGWSFWDPLYTALVFSYAPRTRGRAIPDLVLMPVLGAGVALSDTVRFSVALDVPWAFHYHQMVGLVVYSGVSFRL